MTIKVISSTILAKFLSLTPWCDFRLQYFEKSIFPKVFLRSVLLVVVRLKPPETMLSTSKMTLKVKSSTISAKFLFLTPWCDFGYQYFEKRFLVKVSIRSVLLVVLRLKPPETMLSTSKMTIKMKLSTISEKNSICDTLV